MDSTATTDRERIAAVFEEIGKLGVVCRMNFLCCTTCAGAALADEYGDKAETIFWHAQCDDAFQGDTLTDTLYVHHSGSYAPHVCVAALRAAGFNVEWDGTQRHCIQVTT